MSTERPLAPGRADNGASPTKRRVLIGIAAVIVLCVAGWFLASALRNDDIDQVSATTQNSADGTPTAAPIETTDEAGTAEPSPRSSVSGTAVTPTQAPVSDAADSDAAEPTTPAPDSTEPTASTPDTTTAERTEELPPTTTDAARAPLPGSTPLIQDLPAPASGGQALVESFPTDLMGPVSGTEVVSNSVTVDGSTVQVTLTGRTSASPEEISRQYAELWTSLGFSPQPSGGSSSFTATSDFDWASLSFGPAAEGATEYTAYGFFRTE